MSASPVTLGSDITVAVDVEATLADNHRACYENSNVIKPFHEIDQSSWNWPIREFGGEEEFLLLNGEIWRDPSIVVSPCEPNIGSSIEQIAEACKVDIVTAHQGSSGAIEKWLHEHGVTSYRSFVAIDPQYSKAELGYDIYVDDKPTLCESLSEDQIQYMIKRDYNQQYWNHERVVSVDGLSQVPSLLKDRYFGVKA